MALIKGRHLSARMGRQVEASDAATAASATTFNKSYTIPANKLTEGSIVRIRFQGVATATELAETLTVALKLGSTTLMTIPATDVADNDIFEGEFTLVVREAPSSASECVGVGSYSIGTAGTATRRAARLAATDLATNEELDATIAATWSDATNNSCRLDIFLVEVVR